MNKCWFCGNERKIGKLLDVFEPFDCTKSYLDQVVHKKFFCKRCIKETKLLAWEDFTRRVIEDRNLVASIKANREAKKQ